MITVAIYINGGLIVGKCATNQAKKNEDGETLYLGDSGEEIWHAQEKGAVELAKKILDTIENDKHARFRYKQTEPLKEVDSGLSV